jgi:uncharacterized protein (DUF924 family)
MHTNNSAPIDALLLEWFGTLQPNGAVDPEFRKRWWTKDAAFDAHLRERWGDMLRSARTGELNSWAQTPQGALALVILLDQFSRNIHRDTKEMFAADPQALAIAKQALSQGFHQALPYEQRVFLYMPLMHSEDLNDQEQCISLFKHLVAEAPSPLSEHFNTNVDFAIRHRDIIQRFGRFPHRNAILERETTTEEQAALTQPNSSF